MNNTGIKYAIAFQGLLLLRGGSFKYFSQLPFFQLDTFYYSLFKPHRNCFLEFLLRKKLFLNFHNFLCCTLHGTFPYTTHIFSAHSSVNTDYLSRCGRLKMTTRSLAFSYQDVESVFFPLESGLDSGCSDQMMLCISEHRLQEEASGLLCLLESGASM